MNQSDHNCQEQEIPSVYFNNIIHRDVRPITVEELDAVTIDEFNRQVKLATDNEADLAVKRVRYLIPYILQNIDWETYACLLYTTPSPRDS